MSDISEQDQLLLVNSLLPQEIGQIFKQKVSHTCLDVANSLIAVGTDQGPIWILDTSTRKVVKELNEIKGYINVIRMHHEHSYIGIGTSDGVIAIINYLRPSIKELIKERGQHKVSAMEWTNEGDKLLVGFSSGKIVSCDFQIDKTDFDTNLLFDCKSEVVQLCHYHNLLLISTLVKPVLLDVKSGQVIQVGSRDRKPGIYGGTFTNKSGALIIARPGLRLWIADKDGKVQSTAKYKEILVTSPLPAIPLYGGMTTNTTPSDQWQFGKLLPWKDEWVVGWHGNTVWVLEPHSLSCKGVMTLGQKIIDVSIVNSDLYLLLVGHQRPLVKLSLPSLTPGRARRLLVSKNTEMEPSRLKSDLQDSSQEKEVMTSAVVDVVVGKGNDKTIQASPESSKLDTNSTEITTATNDDISATNDISTANDDISTTNDGISTVNDDISTVNDDISMTTNEATNTKHEAPVIVVTADDGNDGHHQDERNVSNVFDIVGTGLSDLKDKLSQPLTILAAVKNRNQQDENVEKEEDVLNVTKELLSTVEIDRRIKMVEIDDDSDDIAVRSLAKKPRKTKKKRHNKKHKHFTPLSSAHSSVENLNRFNIDDESSNNDTPVMEHREMADIADDNEVIMVENGDNGTTATTTISDSNIDLAVNDIELPINGDADDVNSTLKAETIITEKEEIDVSNEEAVPLPSSLVIEQSEREFIQQVMEDQNVEQSLVLRSLERKNLTFTRGSTPNAIEQARERSLAFSKDPSDDLTSHTSSESIPLSKNDNALHIPFISPIEGEKGYLRKTPESAPYSHSISSSYSLEDTTNHPLNFGPSDSESEDDIQKDSNKSYNKHDSIVASDFYSLVGKLVVDTQQTATSPIPIIGEIIDEEEEEEKESSNELRHRADAFLPSHEDNYTQYDGTSDNSPSIECLTDDIWHSIPQPCHHNIQCLSLSKTSLWLIDSKNTLYWSNPANKGKDWHVMKRHLSQISTSVNGDIIWGVHHQDAYVCYGINQFISCGSNWQNITRKTPVSKRIRWISCDNSSVWAITSEGKVLYRKGVTSSSPEGNMWVEVKSPSLTQIIACNNVVWALDQSNSAYYREGISPLNPVGLQWKHVKSMTFRSISILDTGVIWAITMSDRLLFHCGANMYEPAGRGPWWEVIVSTLIKNSPSPSEQPLWKVMSFERSSSIFQSISSIRSSSANTNSQLLMVSACAEAGLCLLTGNNQLHGCWSVASGYYYEIICKNEAFNTSVWTQVTANNLTPWVVRDDGELFCVISQEQFEKVECQSSVDVLSSSTSALWVLSKGVIWSRQGISPVLPQGYSWEYIQLGTNMNEFITHLAIGDRVAWAVDAVGSVHFRFGVHPREPGTGMAPAWIPVDDFTAGHSILFRSVIVSCDDHLVWGVDRDDMPYIRKGVTSDYPVGTSWEPVNGQTVKKIAASKNQVFALSPSGEMLYRHGITKKNLAGNYWRKLPGKFEEIVSNSSGELWLIDSRGTIKKQKRKVVSISSNVMRRKEKDELEMSMTVDEWEVL
jgi:hypothetical protein